MSKARVECRDCGQLTDWSADGSCLCSSCKDDLPTEGELYHYVEFDLIVRVQTTDYDREEVRVERVDGDHETTVSFDDFEDRVENDKLVPKTVGGDRP